MIPLRPTDGPRRYSPAAVWASPSGKTTCSVLIEAKDDVPLDGERDELVAYLRRLAELFEGPAGGVFFGEGG